MKIGPRKQTSSSRTIVMRGEWYLHLHLGTRIGVGNGLYFGEKVMMNFVTVLKEYRTTSWAAQFGSIAPPKHMRRPRSSRCDRLGFCFEYHG
jgi:hypothetical protein